ncbi:hypothetical protein IID19_01365 [Patescibacteria group bacterium]|nr:hypothetical protein [Patescibacteria group bacterium]
MDFITTVLHFSWEALTWILASEERLALWMGGQGISIWLQILVLSLANMLLITIELLAIHILSKWKLLSRIRTPGILKKLTHNKPVSYQDLFLFSFTPSMQKFGSIALYARWQQLRWRGFMAMSLGGTVRLFFYPILGQLVWVLIVALLVVRVFYWWQDSSLNGSSK